MSTAEEVKSLNQGIAAIQDGMRKSREAGEAKYKKLEDAVADLQAKAQMQTVEGKRSVDMSEVKAMVDYIRTGVAPSVQYTEAGVKAATVANPPSGGYFAIPDFQNRVVERMYDISPMRQIVETINVNGNIAVLPYEVEPPKGKWVGETEKRSDSSDVSVGIAQIPVNEYTVKVSVSNTLLEDSNLVGIENYLINSASAAIDRDVGDAFVTGDGFKKPKGLYTDERLNTIASGKSKGVTAEALYNAMAAVPNDALRNARWTMSMGTFIAFVKAFGRDSTYVNMPMSQSIPATILGYPVTFINAPDISTDGNICATFGDHYHAYKIVQRIGLQYQRDPYTGADDNLVLTRFRTRVGGQLVMPESVVGIKVGA